MKKLFTITLLLSVFIASAQWTTDTDANTLVAESVVDDMKARGTSDGLTYVAFWKPVSTANNYELRLQVLDADGNQTLGSDGVLVSDQIPMGTFVVTWVMEVDADNNLYLGVTGTGSGNPAFVFKMDTDGTQLWGANGLSIGSGFSVRVMPLSAGGAIVSWLAGSGTVMQKYDSTGTAVWPAVQPIVLAGSNTAPGSFFEISGGDYIAVFHERFTGVASRLYAQRYDTDGNSVWANPTQLSDRGTSWNRDYYGVVDGDVVYMGYYSTVGVRFDSYLQRINPDGTLPWGINGSDFDINTADYEVDTAIAFEPGSQHIWELSTYSNQGLTGTFVQKFDKDSGARLFTDNAKEVFAVGTDKVQMASLRLQNGTPLFVMKEGFDNGASPTSLHVVHLDENGDFAWQEESRPLATFMENKGRIQFTQIANMQNVVVFVEDKGAGLKIYAQNVEDDTAGVETFSTQDVFIANPVKNEMVVNSNSSIEAISIFNVLGQQVLSAKYSGENTITINTQNWNSGMYFVKISDENNKVKSIKVIKE